MLRLVQLDQASNIKGRNDIFTAIFDKGTSVAGVFTQSRVPAEPVTFCKKNIVDGKARALIVNAGFANAYTGAKGKKINKSISSNVKKVLKCNEKDIFICSYPASLVNRFLLDPLINQ